MPEYSKLKPHWLIAVEISDLDLIDEIIINLEILGYHNLDTITRDAEFILINSGQMYAWGQKYLLPHFTPISDKDFLSINKDYFNIAKRKDKIGEIFNTGTGES